MALVGLLAVAFGCAGKSDARPPKVVVSGLDDLSWGMLRPMIETAFSAAHPRKSIESFEPICERQKRSNAPPPGNAEMQDLLPSLGHVE